MSIKPIRIKSGNRMRGHGYDEKAKPLTNPTLLPKKKTTPEKTGINIIPNK